MKPTKSSVALCLQLSLLVLVAASVTQAQKRRTRKIESGELYLIIRNRRFGYIDRPGRIAALQQSTTSRSGESYYLTITGADRVIVTDAHGNSNTHIVGTPFDERVPGVQISENEDSADVNFAADLSPKQSYTLTFRSVGKPIEINLTKGQGNEPGTATQIIRYLDLNLSTGTVLMLKITAQGVQNLRYDADDNGSFESSIKPTASAIGESARDVEAPGIVFSEQIQGTNRVVTITATDNFSGVKIIRYSLDGKKYQPYSAPIALNAAQNVTIYAIADDNVGNRSEIFTHEIKPKGPRLHRSRRQIRLGSDLLRSRHR